LALVVPSLASGGGVPAVARFIKEVAVRSGQFDLRVVSLSESARDPLSLRLMAPGSWSNRPAVEAGEWDRIPFVHVGAIASELEFQRYRARRVLSQVIADCDVIQVVCGFPAWANTVVGLGKPLSMHVATRARVERRHRDAQPRTPSEWWRKAMTGITDKIEGVAFGRINNKVIAYRCTVGQIGAHEITGSGEIGFIRHGMGDNFVHCGRRWWWVCVGRWVGRIIVGQWSEWRNWIGTSYRQPQPGLKIGRCFGRVDGASPGRCIQNHMFGGFWRSRQELIGDIAPMLEKKVSQERVGNYAAPLFVFVGGSHPVVI
jgi:hypothetical protein